MKVFNETSYTDRDLKAVAQWVGLDLDAHGTLIVEYMSSWIDSEGKRHTGSCQSVNVEGKDIFLVKVARGASVGVLAHELRHAAQAQAMGVDIMVALYELEEQLEGYEGNIFEIDADGYQGAA
jgi:hypothetical protein